MFLDNKNKPTKKKENKEKRTKKRKKGQYKKSYHIFQKTKLPASPI